MRASLVNRTIDLVRAVGETNVRCDMYEAALAPFLMPHEKRMLINMHAAFRRREIEARNLIPAYQRFLTIGMLRQLVMKKAFMALSPEFPFERCMINDNERASIGIRFPAHADFIGAVMQRAKDLVGSGPALLADVPEARRSVVLRGLHGADTSVPLSIQAERAAVTFFKRICFMCTRMPADHAERALRGWNITENAWPDDAVPFEIESLMNPEGTRVAVSTPQFLGVLRVCCMMLSVFHSLSVAYHREETKLGVGAALAKAMSWVVRS